MFLLIFFTDKLFLWNYFLCAKRLRSFNFRLINVTELFYLTESEYVYISILSRNFTRFVITVICLAKYYFICCTSLENWNHLCSLIFDFFASFFSLSLILNYFFFARDIKSLPAALKIPSMFMTLCDEEVFEPGPRRCRDTCTINYFAFFFCRIKF